MKIEYEVRVLDIPMDEMIRKVKNMGAECVGIYHQKRYVYDFNPVQKGRWIRLRSNGIVSTLAIKEVKSLRVDGTKELEIEVSDFEDTSEIMEKLGYMPRTYQENFRIEYNLGDVNFDFDKWPMIPAYLEIEGQSEEDVRNAMKALGLKENDVTTLDVDKVYYEKYGIKLDDIKELRFSDKELSMVQVYE